MPLKLPDNLPAVKLLKEENIFVMTNSRASSQDIRPLRIVVLNLMPVKITTETDLVRLLSNSPLQIELSFMKVRSHTSKNTPIEHMMAFYEDFEKLKEQKFDGFIVTGAPVEQIEYEDVNYWNELQDIFNWSRTHVQSTLFICWAAQAALYHFYGIQKHQLDKKCFGVFRHDVCKPEEPIFRGFDDTFFMPHSRHTEIWRKDVLKNPKLTLLAESKDSGVGIVMARQGRELFVTGHMEYSPMTLHNEYMRDLGKRDDVDLPRNYYPEDDYTKEPIVRWRAHANLFYHNWINYYVYQETPFNFI